MTTEADFDALTLKTEQSNHAMEDLNNLYGAAFSLSEWHFIARGEFPNVSPYVASNAQYADSLPMVRAFTDTNRLQRFARENNLTDADGGALILSIPTEKIVEYLEQFISDGVYGIWFNSDTGSKGFYVPLKQLRPIKEHLERINRKSSIADSPAAPVASISETRAALDRLSTLVAENAELIKGYDEENAVLSAIIAGYAEGMDALSKEEKRVRISNCAQMFESARREYNMSPGLFEFFIELCLEKRKFIIPVLAFALSMREEEKARRLEQDEELTKELAQWIINKLIPNSDLLNPPGGEPAQQSAAVEDIDINLQLFQKGEVEFDTSIAAFYQAIFPLLDDYRGSGDYTDLLSLDVNLMHDKVENIASNAHGACLRVRRFLYPPGGSGTGVGINTIDSSRLLHVQTQSSLLINFALIKNIAARTAAFYYRFEGPKSEVFNLTAAIKPSLESCGFKAAAQ
ncbi:MAG TPA: hypothetical protein VGB00_15395 [Pyrinomonadaceae bacterium]